jgi:hypothetical protein
MLITVPEVTIAKNQASQRVEFRAVTKAEERIYEIINKLQ